MILEGAPVTGLTLLVSAVSSAMVRKQFTRYYSAAFAVGVPAVPLSTYAASKRLLLQSLPIGPLGFSTVDVFLVVHLLYQFRTLERRWGSNAYLAFLFTSALFGMAATQFFVAESGTMQLSVDAVRIFSGVGSLVPLAALVTRYVREVPSLITIVPRIPGTKIGITEKILVVLPLLKLVFFPETEFSAATYRRAAVVVDVGVWTRLLCVLIGFLFATISRRSVILQWWLLLFTKYVCRPFLRLLRPLSEMLFGSSFSADHAKPRHAQPRHGQRGNGDGGVAAPGAGMGHFSFGNDSMMGGRRDSAQVVDDGRYVVQSLTGGDQLQEVRARMRARRQAARARVSSGSGQEQGHMAAPPRRHRSAPEEAAMAAAASTIEALGLPVTRDEILAALDMTDGHVDMAVQLLLGS